MTFERSSLLYAVGGDVFARHGTFTRRYGTAARGGEEAKEVFTRASIATAWGPNGLLVNFPVDTPRIEYLVDPVTGLTRPYLAIDPVRTNAWGWSEDYSATGDWTRTRVTIGTAIISPRGAATMQKVQEDGSNNTHFIQRAPNVAQGDNSFPLVSFFVRPGGRNFCAIVIVGKDGTERGRYFNLSTGALGTAIGGGSTVDRIKLQPDGSYRIQVAATVATGGGTVVGKLYTASADGTNSYTGDSNSGIYAWGAQWETAVLTTSAYMPTAGAGSASRSTELFTLPVFLQFQSLFYYARFIEGGLVIGNSSNGPLLHGSGSTPFVRWDTFANPGYRFSYQTPAGAVTGAASGVPATGQVVEKLGLIFTNGSVQDRQRINEGTETASAVSSALPFVPAARKPTVPLITVGQGDTQMSLSRIVVGRLYDARGNQQIGSVADAAAIAI